MGVLEEPLDRDAFLPAGARFLLSPPAIAVIAEDWWPAISEMPYLRQPAVACGPGRCSAVGGPTSNERRENALWQL